MPNEAEIKCINKDDRYNRYERITHVGGFARSRWRLTVEDAIRKIERKEWRFYVGGSLLGRVYVEVAISPHGNKYLKTEADDQEPNNLLSLPECP